MPPPNPGVRTLAIGIAYVLIDIFLRFTAYGAVIKRNLLLAVRPCGCGLSVIQNSEGLYAFYPISVDWVGGSRLT